MSLRDTDEILVNPDAIAYIEEVENYEGVELSKFEIVEHFFDWLKTQPSKYQTEFLLKALRSE